MSTAVSRMRKRDSAETLGKLQTKVDDWFQSTPGQITLLVVACLGVVLAGLVGP